MDDATKLAWLDARRSGIGGSDAAAILGIDPWKGPYSVYMSKVSPIGEQQSQNDAMYWGTTLENIVAEEFEKRSDFVLYEDVRIRRPDGTYLLLRHSEYPFMTASVDRYICTTCPSYSEHSIRDHKPDSFLECKTARAGQETKWDAGVPINYYAQVQHYLAVLDMQFCFVACLIGGSTYVTHRVNRNDDYIAELIKKESEFWALVESKTPPPPDDSEATTRLLNDQEAEAGKGIELEPFATFGIIHALKDVKDAISALEAQKKRLENELKVKLGDAELGFIDGRCVVTWKSQTRSGIDAKLLWEERPEIAKQYGTTSSYRVLRVQEIESDG